MESSSSSDRLAELEDSLVAWQDKYERLYESHKRVQKQNQNLEDRLLRLADDNTLERNQWSSDVAKLSVSLADANYLNTNLRREIVSTSLSQPYLPLTLTSDPVCRTATKTT